MYKNRKKCYLRGIPSTSGGNSHSEIFEAFSISTQIMWPYDISMLVAVITMSHQTDTNVRYIFNKTVDQVPQASSNLQKAS